MRKIGYNSQRNNIAVKGLSGSVQCFATSAWMFLSYFAPEKYKVDDDKTLSYFVGDVTRNAASDEFEWSKQAAMIQKYLDAAGVKKKVKLGIDLDTGDGLVSPDALVKLLDENPVIIGTKKLGGLPGGHIILGVDATPDGHVIVNDPYGNANGNYSDANGEGVIYSTAMFDKNSPKAIRCLYVEDAA